MEFKDTMLHQHQADLLPSLLFGSLGSLVAVLANRMSWSPSAKTTLGHLLITLVSTALATILSFLLKKLMTYLWARCFGAPKSADAE